MKRRDWLLGAGATAGMLATGAAWPLRAFAKQPPATPASLGGVINAADFLRFESAGDDAGFDALVAEIRKQGRQVTVQFPKGGRAWSLTGTRVFELPGQVRWDFGGAELRFAGQMRGNSSLLAFGPGSEILGLAIELQQQARFDRLLSIADDTLIDRLQVKAAAQVAKSGDDNIDGMLQIRGSRVRLQASSISGVDGPVMVFGAGATAADSHHLDDVRIDDLRLTSYMTGVHVRNVRNCVIRGLIAQTRSPNASQQPGHNAVLAGHVQDFRLERFRIEDSGEHSVRFGGGSNPAELANKGLHVEQGQIRRAGKCAVKVWGGGKTDNREEGISSDITVRAIDAFDLGFGGKLGVNENMVHLEAVRDFKLQDLSVSTEKASMSCHDGVFIAGGSEGRISGLNVQSAARSALWITDTVAQNEAYPVLSISGNRIRSVGHRGDMIHFDIKRAKSGPFKFTDLESRGGEAVIGGEISGGGEPAVAHFSGRAAGQRAVNKLTGKARVELDVKAMR